MPNRNPNIRMLTNEFNLSVQDKVLKTLADAAPVGMNLRQLEQKIGVSYYSIRNAIIVLEEENKVRPVGFSRRNTPYTVINPDEVTDNSMPVLVTPNGRHKIIEVITGDLTQPTKAETAASNIRSYVVRLLKLAQRAEIDREDVERNLKRTKTRMQLDLQALNQAASVLEQLLSKDTLWDPVSLKRMTEDLQYDRTLVDTVYNYYFKAD